MHHGSQNIGEDLIEGVRGHDLGFWVLKCLLICVVITGDPLSLSTLLCAYIYIYIYILCTVLYVL